jgi:hypothetical protein
VQCLSGCASDQDWRKVEERVRDFATSGHSLRKRHCEAEQLALTNRIFSTTLDFFAPIWRSLMR